jgi:hypothetical protein
VGLLAVMAASARALDECAAAFSVRFRPRPVILKLPENIYDFVNCPGSQGLRPRHRPGYLGKVGKDARHSKHQRPRLINYDYIDT